MERTGAMDGVRGYDVAVIGAGLLGAATAYWISRAGASVALVDAATAGEGASGHSFAWLNAVHKEPEAYHRLNAAGMGEYRAIEHEAGLVVHRAGALHWPATAEEAAVLEARAQRLTDLGYSARWVTRAEGLEREPGVLFPDAAEHLLALDDDGWVDPPSVIGALLASAGDAVHRYDHAPVTAIHRSEASVTGLRAGEYEIAADAFVVCAGAGTSALVEHLGVSIPVERRPGLLLVTSPVAERVLGRVVYHGLGATHDVHLRPDTNGGVRIGSDATDAQLGPAPTPESMRGLAADLLARAVEMLPALTTAQVERVLLGERPVPGDGYTVAGRLPGTDNAYVAVTHSGITLGPLLGRLIAQEVAGAAADPLLTTFRPDRFAGGVAPEMPAGH